jgi:hypothetical protein
MYGVLIDISFYISYLVTKAGWTMKPHSYMHIKKHIKIDLMLYHILIYNSSINKHINYWNLFILRQIEEFTCLDVLKNYSDEFHPNFNDSNVIQYCKIEYSLANVSWLFYMYS